MLINFGNILPLFLNYHKPLLKIVTAIYAQIYFRDKVVKKSLPNTGFT